MEELIRHTRHDTTRTRGGGSKMRERAESPAGSTARRSRQQEGVESVQDLGELESASTDFPDFFG